MKERLYQSEPWRHPALSQYCPEGRGDSSLNPAIWTVHPKGEVGAAGQCSLMPPVRPLSSVSTLTPQMAFGICQLQAKQGSKILGRLTTRASPWPG